MLQSIQTFLNFIKTDEEFYSLIEKLKTVERFAINIETMPISSNVNEEKEIVGYGICFDDQVYFAFNSLERINLLRPFFESENIFKIGFNIISQIGLLFYFKHNIMMKNVIDISLMLRILYPNGIKDEGIENLDELAKNFGLLNQGFMNTGIKNDIILYGAYRSWFLWRLYFILYELLKLQGLIELFENLIEVQKILFLMTVNGIRIDSRLYDIDKWLKLNIERNNKLSLFKGYIDNILKNQTNFCIHANWSFNTETFRVSSSRPNLQGIPNKTFMMDGKEINIRHFFIPDRGYKFILCDFNQIEMRILAHLSRDPNLIKVFKENKDLHAEVAHDLFKLDCSIKEVKNKYPEFRKKAKGINFGIVYGRGAGSIARDIGISYEDSLEYVYKWFRRFDKVLEYKKNIELQLNTTGVVENLFGIKRNFNVRKTEDRSLMVREGINWIIQSSAAIVAHLSLLRTYRRIQIDNIDAMIVLHHHDGFIFEVLDNQVEALIKIIKEEFENWQFVVPIIVELRISDKWD